MSIEYTKVESATRQAFHDTLLTLWGQRWESRFQQEFLAWRYAERPHGETLVAIPSGSANVAFLRGDDGTIPSLIAE